MKKVILSILFIGALYATSCSSDPCKDQSATTKCNGKGTLVASGSDCNCNCNDGYEGASCNTLSYAKFIGSWTALDKTGTTVVGPYTSAIATGTATSSIIIGNFSNLGSSVQATVSGTKLTIPNQVLGTAYTVSGSGTFSTTSTGSSALAMNYTIVQVSSSTSKVHTGTWTK